MKNLSGIRSVFCGAFFSVVLLTGCMKDKITHTYTITTPILQSLAEFRKEVKSQPAQAIEVTGKMTIMDRYIYLSEPGKGIHVIDNTNPSQPKNISFINIPGCLDMAIKEKTLYADSYGDLVTLDITNPLEVAAKDFQTYVFPDRSIYYNGVYTPGTYDPNSIYVVIGYSTHDTTVDGEDNNIYTGYYGCPYCSYAPSAPGIFRLSGSKNNTTGVNGSMARFGIVGDFLYTIGTFNLTAFNIGDPWKPGVASTTNVNFHSETIFPLKGKLFIGTNDGMYMYDILSDPAKPSLLGKFTHLRGCDPVIADDDYAYVTLNDSSACLGFDNQLQVVDIHDMSNTFLVKSYQLSHPMGLAKDGNILFVCDGKDGLKIYDATDVQNLQLLKKISGATFYDVIAINGSAFVMSADGLYQYDYTDINNIQLKSKF